ncbi:hypothetical protein QQS21_010375 [Conoideocrella luteorostrata]|uniref:RNA 3'-terminal phosphate cyclase domain-containing protein n=1 Tax=Conoideocrella luteorostrata TaxID=1105319 RepID=A0AAJ0CHH1_9HYPO|nr:hypothetical protein QQS21_010375 [Conoideocrella luteorostrata]
MKIILFEVPTDGRTGEGGGQLVRVACGLAALTSQPVTITNVRGNREGGRGGGLKTQHVTSLSWLAKVTDAEVDGLFVGSKTLTFRPKRPPAGLTQRNFKIEADTDAASALLILQAILPYVLFAGNDTNDPVVLDIHGGSNAHWSLGYEYFDQVLMPTLHERFGIRIDRELKSRGWSIGPRSRGHITLKIHPVSKGQTLKFTPPRRLYTYPESYEVRRIDASIIVPMASHERVQEELVTALGDLYPDADIQFKVVEDSGHDSRWSILLVAHSVAGIRWARDALFSMPKNIRSGRDKFIQHACSSLCKKLYEETSLDGTVDEFLQDQLIFVQALAEGYSSFPRGQDPTTASSMDALVDKLGKLEVRDGARMRKEKTHEPFGHGSTHTTTARWVASELLPGAEFYNHGDVVKGIAFSV